MTAVPYRSLTLFGEVVRELEVDGICEENGRGDYPRRSGVLALEFQFGQFAGKLNPRVSPALVPSWLKTAGDAADACLTFDAWVAARDVLCSHADR